MIRRLAHLVSISSVSFVLCASAIAAGPTDPYFSKQWYLRNDGTQEVLIDSDRYHTIHQKGAAGIDISWLESGDQISQLAKSPVTVAVIDSGVDSTHPELAGRIAPDGFNFLKDNPPTMPSVFDDMGHGTHVSGIIVANTDNRTGIAGIAPASVKILPLRILSENFRNFSFVGKLISDYAADAINYAVAHNATVINMSLGWPKIVDTEKARKAVQNAIQKGVLIVAAAGNDRKNEPTYPCDYPGVVCVGAITNTGETSVFSNTGGAVDLLAPGDGILSLYPLKVESNILRIQGYELLSGTSQAAPIVSAIAATLRSVFPYISLNELKARLMASTSNPPKEDSSLYGAVNLKRALVASPHAVFLPDFKGNDSVTVDESTLVARGEISVQNLWKSAEQTRIEVTVNGQNAGAATADLLGSGEHVNVPWSYRFGSLDESAQLHLQLKVTDLAGDSRTFAMELPVVRQMDQMPDRRTIPLPGNSWMGSSFGHLYSRVAQVPAYPVRPGLSAYAQLVNANAQGSAFLLFDPENPSPIKSVSVPGITIISKVQPQVLRIDADQDGKLDWLIVGLAQSDKQIDLRFYFMNSDLQPLWGNADQSTWRLAIDSRFAQLLVRNYSQPGSWIRFGKQLIPAFVGTGLLPDPDNYRALSPLHYKSDTHFYFMAPKATASGPIGLELRALDSVSFREKSGNLEILNLIPPSSEEQAQGHLRLLVASDDSLSATTSVLDVKSTSEVSLVAASDWDSLASNGQPVAILAQNSLPSYAGFLNFFDEARGSLTWSSTEGSILDTLDFSFKSIDNPILGLIGAVNLGNSGKFAFFETRFDIVAYQSGVPGKETLIKMLPIEHDSSFPGQEFSEMFSPVVVGTSDKPLPGVYIDSTLVRGNQISIVAFNPESGEFSKPLRYSFQIPEGCVQMAPAHLSESPDSLTLPLFCQANGPVGQVEFKNIPLR